MTLKPLLLPLPLCIYCTYIMHVTTEMLQARQRKVCQVHSNASIEEAIHVLTSNNASSSMVYDDAQVGILYVDETIRV